MRDIPYLFYVSISTYTYNDTVSIIITPNVDPPLPQLPV
jgi:hypothetical protein